MKILTEETFGPVVPIVTFTDEEEVINMANNSDYGLAAYIFSQIVKRCLTFPEKLEYGIVGVNEGFLETKLVSYGV